MRTKKIEVVLVTLLAVFFLSFIALAVDCPIPDTGQTKCYDNTQEITCPQPGEPFYGQDAQYTCNPHSYTKLDENGNDLPDDATEWVMVWDNVTGLIWENKTDDGSIHDRDDEYNWEDAQDVFIATLNSQDFGGHSDWRLPTVKELTSIVDRGSYGPSINTTYFSNTGSVYGYWSSTTFASSPYLAWGVDFLIGLVGYCKKSDGRVQVRAVRGGQDGSLNNFVDNWDGTVTDTNTGLVWQQDGSTYNTWEEALSYCENLTLAGYNDWRLPNVNELQSLVDYSRHNPAIDPVFSNTVSSSYPSGYWSSTTYVIGPGYAWVVSFDHGYIRVNDKRDYNSCVRAVRGPFTTTTSTLPQPCLTETIYGEHSEQTDLLRYLRDNVLSQTPEGQEIIKLYYELSPVIVEMINEDEEFRQQVKGMIDGVMDFL